MKPPCITCGRYDFPHRRESKCDLYESRTSLDRTREAVERGVYESEFKRLSREAAVPCEGEI